MNSAYRLAISYHPGDKVKVLDNRWGYAQEGDIGILLYQHYTELGGRMVPAGWVVKTPFHFTMTHLFWALLNCLFLCWGRFSSSHLFEDDFERIGER